MRRTTAAGLLAWLVLPACRFAGTAGQADSGPGDATPDAALRCADWGQRRFFRGDSGLCDLPAPVAAPELAGELILLDTTNGTLDPINGTIDGGTSPVTLGEVAALHDANGGQAVAWVISVQRFAIPNGLRLQVIGDKPLVIAGWSGVTVDGILDAGSSFTGDGTPIFGPGSSDVGACPDLDGIDATNGGGGGGGGGFGGAGGPGGQGDNGNTGQTDGGDAVAASSVELRAGCSGGQGGDGNDQPGGGIGGSGGGAVVLASIGTLALSGQVLAGGAGGRKPATGSSRCAGGGGGSGGLIALDAPTLAFDGALVAANGGGGGGGANNAVDKADDGSDGTAGATAAPGGIGEPGQGGDGGNGGSRAGPATNGLVESRGGGGGGGGVGIVLVPGEPPLNGTIISPEPSQL